MSNTFKGKPSPALRMAKENAKKQFRNLKRVLAKQEGQTEVMAEPVGYTHHVYIGLIADRYDEVGTHIPVRRTKNENFPLPLYAGAPQPSHVVADMDTRDRIIAEGWTPLDKSLPPVGQWVLLLLDHNEDSFHQHVLKRPRFFIRHAWCFAHRLEEDVPRACFNTYQSSEYALGLTGDVVKYWRLFPAVPDIPYEDSQE